MPKGPSRSIKITKIGAGAIPTFKLDNVVARYGEGEGVGRPHVVYIVLMRRLP